MRFSETPKRSARRDRASPPEAPPPTECETIARAHARLQPRAPDDAFAMRTDEGAPVSSQGDEPHLQPTGIVRKKRPRGRPRRETTPTPPSKKRKPYDPHKDLRLGRFFRFRVDASGEPGRDDADPPRWVHGITSHRINARGEHHGKYWVLRDPERGEYDTHEQGWAATLAQDDDARFPEPLDVARLERDGLLEYVDLHFFPHPTTPDAPLEPKPAPKTNRGDDDGARSDREVGEDDHHHGDQNRPKGVALDAVAGAVAGAVRVGAVDHSEDDNDALEALACAAEAAGASTAPAKRTPQRRSPSVTPTPTRRSPHSSPRTPPGLDADRGENEDFVRRLVSQLVVDESDKERAGVVEERRMSFEPATIDVRVVDLGRDVRRPRDAFGRNAAHPRSVRTARGRSRARGGKTLVRGRRTRRTRRRNSLARGVGTRIDGTRDVGTRNVGTRIDDTIDGTLSRVRV